MAPSAPESPEGAEPASSSIDPEAGQIALVAYLVNKRARSYIHILDVLLEEESRLGGYLSVPVIADRIQAVPNDPDLPDPLRLEALLTDLHRWGNVDRIYSRRRKSTVHDYMRKDHYYQLTAQGAQVHREIIRITQEVGVTGALQSSMLPAVLQALDELTGHLTRSPFDAARANATYRRLTSGFSELSENAKLFVQGLNRSLETDGELQLEAFLAYKDVVVRYLNSFTLALSRHAPRITTAIETAEQAGITDRFTALAAVDASPVLGRGSNEIIAVESERLAQQWSGLRSWFHGDHERLPVADILQERAAEAVSQIMQIVQQINDRRFRRINRVADLTTLARWFENAPNPQQVSGLWQRAFGLKPARHLGFPHQEDDDSDHRPHVSWWHDSPAPVAMRLRHQGPRAGTGAPPRIPDPRAVKRRLSARQTQRDQARTTAEQSLIARGPTRLSALGELSADEADLFLTYLTTVLSARPASDGVKHARSRDGRLAITLAPPASRHDATTVDLPPGRLGLQDFQITVSLRTGASA
ncbi:TIGR02677 family protein [Streptomyces anulatus]